MTAAFRMKPVDFEVFNDPSYFDMWAVRPRGVRDFNNTLHFPSERDARFAAQVIGNWMGNKPPKETP